MIQVLHVLIQELVIVLIKILPVYVHSQAFDFILFFFAVDRSYEELQWLLTMVQNDPVPYIRLVN